MPPASGDSVRRVDERTNGSAMPAPEVVARRRLVALGVVAIAVATVVLVVVNPFGDDDGGGSDGSAEATVQAYIDAAARQDFEAVCSLFTGSLRRQFGGGECPALLAGGGGATLVTDLTIVGVTVEGETATAVATIGDSPAPPAPDAVTQELELQLVEGEWKLSRLG
jgi:hypothetical protein